MKTPTAKIRRDTRVFISAVSRELGSVRKLVKKGLEDNDYHAVEQENFPPEYRQLVDTAQANRVLRRHDSHRRPLLRGRAKATSRRRASPKLHTNGVRLAVELGNPEIWFLPLSKPISPHLDELMGPVTNSDQSPGAIP